MTLLQIRTDALNLLGEDTTIVSDDTKAVMNHGINCWQHMIANTINILVKDSTAQTFAEELPLPDDCVRLLYVLDGTTGKLYDSGEWFVAGKTVYFQNVADDVPTSVKFRYTYHPVDMTTDSAVPEIPVAYHKFLVKAAAAAYCLAHNKQGTAQIHEKYITDMITNQLPINHNSMIYPAIPDTTPAG